MLIEVALIIIELSVLALYIGLIQRDDIPFSRKKVYIAILVFVMFTLLLTGAVFIYHAVQSEIPWY